MRSKHADLLKTIATEKALSDDTRAKLKSALDEIKKTYAA
jgi:F-type H+-transporting ATPase subunit alpha